MAEKKGSKGGKYDVEKKNSGKGDAKKGNSAVKNQNTGAGTSKPAGEHVFIKSAAPYIIMVFALILGICFITVRLLDLDDGAGVVGYWIQWFFCGLFGGAAFIIPAALGYIGVKWCLYNIKWPLYGKSGAEQDEDTAREHRNDCKRARLQTIMASLIVVLFSVVIGVIADEYGSVDIVSMWTDAADDLVGGGIIGSLLALFMVTCFEKVISLIILFVFVLLAAIFMAGLTPDRIVLYIRYRRKIAKEKRAERIAKEREDEELRRAEEAKHMNRLSVPEKTRAAGVAVAAPSENKKKINMSVDELVGDASAAKPAQNMNEPEKKDSEPELMPLETDIKDDIYIGPAKDRDKTYIGVSGKIEIKPEREEKTLKTVTQENVGRDYGSEASSDAGEFRGLDDVMENLRSETPQKTETVPVSADTDAEQDGRQVDLGLIVNEELLSDVAAVAPDENTEEEIPEIETPYVFPPVDMLEPNKNDTDTDYSAELQENAKKLMDTLRSFKVGIREITYSRGPTITRYELKPDVGIRVRSIANLVDDIALNLATTGVRIEAPIPNKPAVGIEVPNRNRATVYLRDLIDSPKFSDAKSKLTACLGMDVGGNPIYFDIAKMPHLLIAGATGMGKSVCINSIIVSLLYKAKPDELKLILIDPKKVEFNIYKDIPHLYAPIVSDPKKAAGALASAVGEMERRFELIEEVGVRDIGNYNAITEGDPEKERMPHMVIIIDELADLMMTAPDEVESSICRLAQKARAAGIHIVIGTQRPSVDVITGLIKANVPSRIAFTVASQVDSRTILDIAGAEKLIGRGDMLFAPVGASKPMRVQGAYVSESDVEKIVSFIKNNNSVAKYNSEFISRIEEEAAKCGMGKKGAGSVMASGGDEPGDVEGGDVKFREAVKLAIEEGKISTSLMQRRLGLGYGRAAKIIDTMEQYGYVSKPDGNKPRRVIITMDEYMRRVMDNNLGGTDDQ